MFTGLIQRVGRFQGLRRREGGWSLACPTGLGDGAGDRRKAWRCRGVPDGHRGAGRAFCADVLDETLERTALGRWRRRRR